MKKVSRVLASLMLVAVATTSCTTTDSSEVTLVVDQIGNDKGIPNVQMESGFVFYFPPTQDVFTYPTNIQHVEWDKDHTTQIDVTSSDGASFGLDVALNIRLVRERSAELFTKYRVPMKDLIDTRIRSLVRKELVDNSVSFASDSLLQHRNIYEAAVDKSLRARLEKEGFLLDNISVLKMDLPKSYRDAINKKIKVIQETATIKSQTQQAEQDALKKVAIAKGNYESALYDAKTKEIMSQPKMIELYKAETDRIWAQKGQSPWGNNNVFGAGSGIILNR